MKVEELDFEASDMGSCLVGTNLISNVFVSLPCWLINNPELGLNRARLGGLVYISRYTLHSFREWL